jgi:GNAT superfamily N-acetyltransferase
MSRITLSPVTENNLEEIGTLQPEGWSDIVPHFTYYLCHSFCYPVKITAGQSIVGIGAGISLGDSAWLAHIIVKPEFRKKGIGTTIVRHLCDYLQESGATTLSLIATDLGYPVYKKAGFMVQTEYFFYEKPGDFTLSLSTQLLKISGDEFEEAFSLDKKITGEERKVLLDDVISTAYVYKENKKITGVYIPDAGEGTIVAHTEEAGTACLGFRLKDHNKCVLPGDNREGIQFLEKNGCKKTAMARRMFMGKELPWNPGKIYNRIAGNCG